MSMTPKALIVATSHDRLGETGERTGFWWEELAAPYRVFADGGFKVDIASIRGGEPPADPRSIPGEGHGIAAVDRFRNDPEAMRKLAGARPVSAYLDDDLDIVFLVGGHGAVWDMPEDRPLADLLTRTHAQGGVVAAVCHGPAGLVSARAPDGRPLVAGHRIACFTDAEERAVGFDRVVPFLLETRLSDLGAFPEPGPDFEPKAVRDGRLVTGQNPMSSEATARLALEAAKDPVGR